MDLSNQEPIQQLGQLTIAALLHRLGQTDALPFLAPSNQPFRCATLPRAARRSELTTPRTSPGAQRPGVLIAGESRDISEHSYRRRSYRLSVLGSDLKPLLLLDVDGVLNPYPDCPSGFEEYRFFPEDDEPVRLAEIHRRWLHELAARFVLVWASAWGEEANRLLCPHFRLPVMPVVALPPARFDPVQKVGAIEAFVGDRAAAWVDDIVTLEAKRWAYERPQPTLVIQVEPSAGLTRAEVDELFAWATSLSALRRHS